MEVNQIICGDCLEVMKDMEDNSVDMVLTSPPYDNLRDYKTYTFDFESTAAQIYRVIKDGGVCVWVVGDQTIDGSETGTSFKQALYFKDVCGFNLHDTMIYQKDGCPFPSQYRYASVFEYMFVFSKGKPKTFNPIKIPTKWFGVNKGSTYRQKQGKTLQKDVVINEYKIIDNIWKIPGGYMKGSKEPVAFEHPAIFPEQLAKDHISSWSNPNDIIFDPCSGSGTTCKIAEMLGRRYIGIDISEQYCQIARERIKAIDSCVPVKEARKGQRSLFEKVKQ